VNKTAPEMDFNWTLLEWQPSGFTTGLRYINSTHDAPSWR